jgi:spermidine/putrescine transport system permease protein
MRRLVPNPRDIVDRIRRDKRLKTALLLSPALIFLLIFFFSPFIIAIMFSFDMFEKVVYRFIFIPRIVLEYYIDFITLPGIQNVIFKSIYYALSTTVGTLMVAYPLSYYLSFKVRAKYKNMLVFIIFLPFWVNFIVRVYALKFIFHGAGPFQRALISLGIIKAPIPILGTDSAVIITMIYSYIIFMILPLYGVMEKIDKSLIEASLTLGASPLRTFLKVTLPLSIPGIIAGSLIVFIPAVGEFIIPILVGGVTTSTLGLLIYDYFIRVGGLLGWGIGSAASIIYIIIIATLSYIYIKLVGGEVKLA